MRAGRSDAGGHLGVRRSLLSDTPVDSRCRNCRRWKGKLLDLYLLGKDDSEPNGAGLRHIRNREGRSWVDKLSKAALDKLEWRLAPTADGLA